MRIFVMPLFFPFLVRFPPEQSKTFFVRPVKRVISEHFCLQLPCVSGKPGGMWFFFLGGSFRRVAPNIYYLGFAGVVTFGGLRIGGLSGIYNHHHFKKGNTE